MASARAGGLDKLDADLLLLSARGIPAHALDAARSWLIAHDTDTVSPDLLARYSGLVQRRRAGEPLAYITGCKEFYGLALAVDPRVLVPRPDTETLVDWALELLGDGARIRGACSTWERAAARSRWRSRRPGRAGRSMPSTQAQRRWPWPRSMPGVCACRSTRCTAGGSSR